MSDLQGHLIYSVGVRRLELPAPTSRTWYATNCATPRILIIKNTVRYQRSLSRSAGPHPVLSAVASAKAEYFYKIQFHFNQPPAPDHTLRSGTQFSRFQNCQPSLSRSAGPHRPAKITIFIIIYLSDCGDS